MTVPHKSSSQIQEPSTMMISPQLDVVLPQPVPDGVVEPSPNNVLFFGETGVGKSSVINMLVGEDIDASRVSNGAGGCTSGSVPYLMTHRGQEYVLWDTAGLNECDQGSVPPHVAIRKLAELAEMLKDGLHLLVYVIRGTRFREVVRLNYELFYRVVFDEKVPIVVVVTGLENEEPMEAWWETNGPDLRKVGLVFDDHVCITATRGRLLKTGHHAYEEEYEVSKQKLRALVVTSCSPMPGAVLHSQVNVLEEIVGDLPNAGVARGRSRRGNGHWPVEDVSEFEGPDTLAFLDLVRRVYNWFALAVRLIYKR